MLPFNDPSNESLTSKSVNMTEPSQHSLSSQSTETDAFKKRGTANEDQYIYHKEMDMYVPLTCCLPGGYACLKFEVG